MNNDIYNPKNPDLFKQAELPDIPFLIPMTLRQDDGSEIKIVFNVSGVEPTGVLSGKFSLATLDVAALGWIQTCVFASSGGSTVTWTAGTFTAADGTPYAIGAGTTGVMASKTYIYLDTAVSKTAYQITTTAKNAVGAGKILIGIAENNATEAKFMIMNDNSYNIDASNIVANSITANELAASIIYAGSLVIDTAGLIRSGQTDYDTGTGWWIGNKSGTPKLSIGNSAGYKLTWDGSNLTIVGTVPDTQTFTVNGTWTKPAGAKFVRVVCIGAGGGGGSGKNWSGLGGGGGVGGASGGGGAVSEKIFDASVLGATETVVVGVGGVGGVGVQKGAGSASGNPGADGGLSSFGTWIQAGGGGGGGGGVGGGGSSPVGGGGGGILTSASGSTAGTPSVAVSAAAVDRISGQGTYGANNAGTPATITENAEYGGASGAYSTVNAGGSSIFGGPAGGSGSDSGTGTATAGGTCGSYTKGGGGAAGASGAVPTAGTPGSSSSVLKKGYCGSGGGGGGGTSTLGVNGAAGGAGGIPGAGGGGGGGFQNIAGNAEYSGAGGDGGRGEVRIYTS